MGSAPASSQWAVVIDANVLIAICAREREKLNQAEAAINEYASKGWLFYAPGVVVGRLQHDGILRYNQGNRLKKRFDWASQPAKAAAA
jgi:hypothetical protein